jgi:hypothetical protein
LLGRNLHAMTGFNFQQWRKRISTPETRPIFGKISK